MPQTGPEDRRIVQEKGDGAPEDGIADAGQPHHESRRDADGEVHDRDRHEIGGNVAFDLLGDVDRLPLAGEARQYFDDPAQETVARHQQEIQKQHRREEAGWRSCACPRTRSPAAPRRRADWPRPHAAPVPPKLADLIQKMLQRCRSARAGSRAVPEAAECRRGVWRPRSPPGRKWPCRDATIAANSAMISNRAASALGMRKRVEHAQHRLQQQIEREGEDQRQHDFGGDIGGGQQARARTGRREKSSWGRRAGAFPPVLRPAFRSRVLFVRLRHAPLSDPAGAVERRRRGDLAARAQEPVTGSRICLGVSLIASSTDCGRAGWAMTAASSSTRS